MQLLYTYRVFFCQKKKFHPQQALPPTCSDDKKESNVFGSFFFKKKGVNFKGAEIFSFVIYAKGGNEKKKKKEVKVWGM